MRDISDQKQTVFHDRIAGDILISEIKPTRGKLVAQPDEPATKIGAIFIPENGEDIGAQGEVLECTVLALGPPFYCPKRCIEIPWDFKVGDRIMRQKYAGVPLVDDTGKRVAVVLGHDQVTCVLTED